MEDQIVSFETAKLAKEKGLSIICQKGFNPNTGNIIEGNLWLVLLQHESDNHIQGPTQSLLKKWLQTEHKLNINIRHIPHNQKYGYSITGSYHDGNSGVLKPYDFKSYDTYEEAMEDGLLETLKLIK